MRTRTLFTLGLCWLLASPACGVSSLPERGDDGDQGEGDGDGDSGDGDGDSGDGDGD